MIRSLRGLVFSLCIDSIFIVVFVVAWMSLCSVVNLACFYSEYGEFPWMSSSSAVNLAYSYSEYAWGFHPWNCAAYPLSFKVFVFVFLVRTHWSWMRHGKSPCSRWVAFCSTVITGIGCTFCVWALLFKRDGCSDHLHRFSIVVSRMCVGVCLLSRRVGRLHWNQHAELQIVCFCFTSKSAIEC